MRVEAGQLAARTDLRGSFNAPQTRLASPQLLFSPVSYGRAGSSVARTLQEEHAGRWSSGPCWQGDNIDERRAVFSNP